MEGTRLKAHDTNDSGGVAAGIPRTCRTASTATPPESLGVRMRRDSGRPAGDTRDEFDAAPRRDSRSRSPFCLVPSALCLLLSGCEAFDFQREWLLGVTVFTCGAILVFITLARGGRRMWVRPIPALEAFDEAVGRATEMGKPCLFVPGVQDINDVQTIAGVTVLRRVAERTADYRTHLEVPTARSLVMTACSEAVSEAYVTAGRPDLFNPDSVYYVTDEQFGYVAYLTGMMVREEPAACFYMGAFYAESLILAETGNAVGAIQVAGTAQPSQLPFFVAACDYTLIGEEFFAASAYLSGNPDELGTLKGQDVGKLLAAGLMIVGVGLSTAASLADRRPPAAPLPAAADAGAVRRAAEWWKGTLLSGGKDIDWAAVDAEEEPPEVLPPAEGDPDPFNADPEAADKVDAGDVAEELEGGL